ncbi:MAG: patatin-like phospholipase family protein [Spirochaetales bacterium]|nr:patatin-like phospholipase family protein [Spirochaetales bacterium]
MLRRAFVFFLLAVFCVTPLLAADNLLLLDTPFVYGGEEFVKKIEERTGGQREPVGLVLSGGSARAWAHIGVLKYLEEKGMVPDFIISNSMGSIIAMLYSAGFSPDQILRLTTEINISELFALALPVNRGLLDVEQFKAMINVFLPDDLKVEDLYIPVMIICEDLTTKRQVRITEGDFTTVMAASFALPVYFDSVSYNGHLLTDGGQVNLAPLEVAYNYAPFNILSTTFNSNSDVNLKNPITALNVSIDIGKSRNGIEEIFSHSDDSIWIRCDVEGFSFMDFDNTAEIAGRGYDSAKATLEAEETAAKLAGISFGTLPEAFAETRSEIGERIDRFERSYSYYHHTGSIGLSASVGLGGRSYAYPGDSYALRNDVLTGLRYDVRYKDLELSAVGGLSARTYNFAYIAPAAEVFARLYLFDAVRIEADAGLILDTDLSIPALRPQLYVTLRGTYVLPVFDPCRISLDGSWEMAWDFGKGNRVTPWTGYSQLFTYATAFSFSGPELSTQAQAGINATLVDSITRVFGFVRFRADYSRGSLRLGSRVSGRFAFDSQGDVPYLVGDGFYTNSDEILRQGSPSGQAHNQRNSLVGAGVSVGLNLNGGRPVSMGEILLMEGSSVSLYCDLLWYRQAEGWQAFVPAVSSGVQFETDLSLIGLRKVSLALYAGYDGPMRGFICGLWFKSEY